MNRSPSSSLVPSRAAGTCAALAAAILVQLACDRAAEAPSPVDADAAAEYTFHQDLCWSPDGSRIAFSAMRIPRQRWDSESYAALGDAQYDVWVVNADGGVPRRLTDDPASDLWATWSPDGRRVAFVSKRTTPGAIYAIGADGGDVSLLIDGARGEASSPDWSPDGAHIVFTRDVDGQAQIHLANADGSDERRLTRQPANHWGPRWSPDGSQIVFYADREGRGRDQIYVLRADGSGERQVTRDQHNNFFPNWSADGTHIVFASNREGEPANLYRVRADGSGLERLVDGAFFGRPAPDGSRLAFITGRLPSTKILVGAADGSGAKTLVE